MKEGLTTLGMLFMFFGWASILLLNVYCFAKIFNEKKEKIVSTMEVESEIDELDRNMK